MENQTFHDDHLNNYISLDKTFCTNRLVTKSMMDQLAADPVKCGNTYPIPAITLKLYTDHHCCSPKPMHFQLQNNHMASKKDLSSRGAASLYTITYIMSPRNKIIVQNKHHIGTLTPTHKHNNNAKTTCLDFA